MSARTNIFHVNITQTPVSQSERCPSLPLGTGKADVRLVENGSQLGRYIALSHCWGSSQLCVLDFKTISQFKKSIPWSRLPKTFQDAIIFSAKLGVNHIWIDALCIAQDDPDDWERESAKMADIYQNSFLTLAATASSSGMGGCFSDQTTIAPSEARTYKITISRRLKSHRCSDQASTLGMATIPKLP